MRWLKREMAWPVSDVLEGRDEGQLSEVLLTQALQGRSDVVGGIYNAGVAANLAVERAIKRYTLRLVCRPSLASRAPGILRSIAVPDIRLKAASLVTRLTEQAHLARAI